MIYKARNLVCELLGGEDTGHGMEHIDRVFEMAMNFAKREKCDKTIVALIALLHDVDDYKIFGRENQENLTNTNRILDLLNVSDETKRIVLSEVSKIGYSKALKGLRPTTIEGKIVSDADMCDVIGANGILRTFQYELKHGKPFFDRNIWPMEEVNGKTYGKKCSDTAVCHMFEKVLKVKNMMMTDSGKEEAVERHEFVVKFLNQLFKEENASEWQKYLDEFLNEVNNCC